MSNTGRDTASAGALYELVVYWSATDAAYVVEVPDLAETVVCEWLETARELGRAIPEPLLRLPD
jgi:predicted RNase H-like HicB family nuclease